jgi:microcystin-dependent protein
VIPFAGSAAPTGWHLCDGTAVSRTGNPNLFSAIGTSWGAGNGTTTFNLPDLQGRTVFGVDGGTGRLTSASIGTSAVLGVTAGDQLAQADTITATVTDPSHIHYYDSFYGGGGTVGLGAAAGWSNISNSGTFGTRSAVTGITVAAAGTNDGAQQNIPPMGVINWIIQLS